MTADVGLDVFVRYLGMITTETWKMYALSLTMPCKHGSREDVIHGQSRLGVWTPEKAHFFDFRSQYSHEVFRRQTEPNYMLVLEK